jgi:hypothetical protein
MTNTQKTSSHKKSYLGARNIAHWYLKKFRPGSRGFHGDRVLRKFVKTLLERHSISAFVETGTSKGETTAFVAQLRRSLPVYTCEVHPPTFRETAERLTAFPNIEMRESSSPDFLQGLTAKTPLGNLPLFWLDAHWYEFWPLRDELSIITGQLGSAVILIDDFEIPGRPQFGYDTTNQYHGRATTEAPIKCNLDYIKDALDPRHTYNVIFPKYPRHAAFPFWDDGAMRGYPAIVMDAPALADSLLQDPFFESRYERYSDFSTTSAN